ncbi:MAG: GNAT family N-acetyltransferase [Chloroflexi bacterium]|nr:GNAT family N-acetyltransferase [Chloroflexota bacterium]
MNKNSKLFLRDHGDGLILRSASAEDADALAAINGMMHSDDGPENPNPRIAAWTRDLLAKPHPTLTAGDFTIVEETASGRIVSTLCLIPQTWTYEGVEFGVGRPELVCTLPEFRKRGLVRVQMEEVHQWSEKRGHLAQVITGIPYFYRQFGYDMALNYVGRHFGFEPHVPALKDGETEKYLIRPAQDSDADFILRVYEANEKRYAISCRRTPEHIRYEMSGQSSDNINHFDVMMIEDANGKPLGFFKHAAELWFEGLYCTYFGLDKGASWLDVSPAVARYLWKKGGEYAERDSQKRTSFGFNLGEGHPVYEALEDKLPAARKPYAYYVRVPDLPAFLSRIQPALEQRLADSIATGYTGELKINFYREGLRMVFERGLIAVVEPMKISVGLETDAAFPDLTFLHLVFGHRSLDELRHAFADCYWTNHPARVLLNILFPKRPSNVFPVY